MVRVENRRCRLDRRRQNMGMTQAGYACTLLESGTRYRLRSKLATEEF
jgi:hypothetical protein